MEIELRGEKLVLLPEKCIYWPREKALLLADLHLGKVSHFRKNGIAVPAAARLENLERLHKVLEEPRPQTVIFLGDLFHSSHNTEWIEFGKFLESYRKIRFILITGNHDILRPAAYEEVNITATPQLLLTPFFLTHEPQPQADLYNLCGHIHPAVKLKSASKQTLRMPCFLFRTDHGMLPAFSSFAGAATVKPVKEDLIYIPAGAEVISMSQ